MFYSNDLKRKILNNISARFDTNIVSSSDSKTSKKNIGRNLRKVV